EVVIYDTDGTTAIFGGVVFRRQTRGVGQLLFVDVDCVDWVYYLDTITVPGMTLTGTFTLLQVLEWIQDNLLAARGFTLDANQVTGPSWSITGYQFQRMTLSAFLRDHLGPAAAGYVFYVLPDRTWGMANPSLETPTAPFSVTDTAHARSLQWED